MTKLTCSKIKSFIADERKGAAEYNKYGLGNLARDESKHRIFLMGKAKEMGCNCNNMKGGFK